VSNDSMGNLEKLGILVIVILVVVVGVVAVMPTDTLFPSNGDENVAAGKSLDDNVPLLEPLRPDGFGDYQKLDVVLPAPPDASPEVSTWPGSESRSPVEPAVREPELEVRTVADAPPPRIRPDVVRTPEPAADPGYRIVTVQSGDSFYRIAERELGNPALYKEIIRLNPSVDPRRIKAGDEIRIPTGSAADRRKTPERGTRVGGRRGAADEKTYVVQGNDTPGQISTKFYGTAAHWRHILDHNGIKSETGLQKDATIRIPPAPESSSNAAPARRDTSSDVAGWTGKTYDVQPGEMLADIAREQLGDRTRWPEILELNGLKSARELKANTTIRLPR